MKRSLQLLIFLTHHHFDPVQIGKSLIPKVGGQADELLGDKWLKMQQGPMAGLENLEVFLASTSFSGADHQILVHFGAASQADALFQFCPIKQLLFFLARGTYCRADSDFAFAAFSQSTTLPSHIHTCLLQRIPDGLSLTNPQPEVTRQNIQREVSRFPFLRRRSSDRLSLLPEFLILRLFHLHAPARARNQRASLQRLRLSENRSTSRR
ncbi:hypothetical protein ES703_57428 [subsurface metagenome]